MIDAAVLWILPDPKVSLRVVMHSRYWLSCSLASASRYDISRGCRDDPHTNMIASSGGGALLVFE